MCVGQRLLVDDEAAGEVEEDRARPHRGELLVAEEAGVADPAVDVQRDDVGHLEQLVEGVAAAGVAQRQLVGGVVEDDATCRAPRPAPTAGCRCCRSRRCRGVRPRISCAPLADLSQTPSCSASFFSVSRRVSEIISAMASSTTLRVLENGALNTATAALGAAARSIWLVPMQNAPTASRSGRAGERRPRSPRVLDRMPEQLDAGQRVEQLVLVEGAGGRGSTSTPAASSWAVGVGMDVLEQQGLHGIHCTSPGADAIALSASWNARAFATMDP